MYIYMYVYMYICIVSCFNVKFIGLHTTLIQIRCHKLIQRLHGYQVVYFFFFNKTLVQSNAILKNIVLWSIARIFC